MALHARRHEAVDGREPVRRWLARVWTYGRSPEGHVWDSDTGRSIVPHLRGAPVAYYPEYRFGHAPLAEVERRGGPDPDAVVGEVLECWTTADGVDALLEVLDGPSHTELSLAYRCKVWPRPGGDRVEFVTRIWSLDLVARSLCAGRLVREAAPALCWKLSGEVAPRGRWLDRLAAEVAPSVRRPAAMVTQERSATRLAEILNDDACLPFTLAPEGDR